MMGHYAIKISFLQSLPHPCPNWLAPDDGGAYYIYRLNLRKKQGGFVMTDRVIRLEEEALVDPEKLDRLMRLVPDDQRGDIRLKRFLAFRLKLDGLVACQAYLSHQISAAEQSAFKGRLYDFLSQNISVRNDDDD
jgi:hypothetical protein